MRHLLLVLFALLDSLDIGNPDPDSDIKLILLLHSNSNTGFS